MYRKLQQFIIILILAFGASSIQAQDLFAKANKQFQLGAYDLAIYNYQKILKEDPNNASVIGNLAEAYFRTQNYMDAIRWYEELGEYEFMEPRHMINYAHVLKSLGQFDKAQVWYWKYKSINSEVGDHFAMSCDHAKFLLQQNDLYDVSLFKGNSPSSDFGVSFYENKIIYCSFRTDMKRETGKRNFSHVQKPGNQLFVSSDKQNANFTNINFLRSDLKETHSIGPICYSGEMVAYTQNNFADGYKHITGMETELNIFFASVADANGDFENERAFIHNERGSSTAYPTFSEDGKTMIFSSNRIGGEGKFDLYISKMENGEWGAPQNLGNVLNTPGNEITPFIKGDELYFSSDYHSGIGGYDIFKATMGFDGAIETVENLGKGINSPMDDYYYTIDPLNNVSYFSSNRLGGEGREDIYMARPINEQILAYNSPQNDGVPSAVNLDDLAESRGFVTEEKLADVVRHEEKAISTEDGVFPASTFDEPEVFEKIIETNKDEETVGLTAENVITNISSDEIVKVEEELVDETAISSVMAGTDNDFDLAGAKKVAIKDVITAVSNVYFIQLASLTRSSGDVRPFMKLSALGNLYKVKKGGVTKIRMGYFFDEAEATQKLREVRNSGFRDAFIVYEPLVTSQLELVNVSTNKTYYEGEYIPTGVLSNYKVRLASYTDPLWFDTGSVKDIGEIEQWTKGDFTIFVLSGYSSIEEADQALIKAINRGYTEAHLVEDVNGYLQKVRRN